MYIISGCPRSGTSMMMDIMIKSLGEERLLGYKFPRKTRLEKINKKEIFEYIRQKKTQEGDDIDIDEHVTSLNPNGFYEMEFTTMGLRYSYGLSDVFQHIEHHQNENKPLFCKIVSQGLLNSDPRYIDKVVYMLRNPREVATSQENLLGRGGKPTNTHTPEMFIRVTTMAARWFLENPDKPYLIINHHDILKNPRRQLFRLQNFLQEGEFVKKGIGVVDKKLKRSSPKPIEHELWEDADHIYNLFKQEKFQEIVDYMEKPNTKTNLKRFNSFCVRTNKTVNYDICFACKQNKEVRDNYKKQAEKDGISWENEPCVYECMGLEGKDVSIKESINNNFWVE